MPLKTKKLLIGGVALAVALSLAACGSNSAGTDDESLAGTKQTMKKVDDLYEFSEAVADIPGKRTDGPYKVEFAQYWAGLPILRHYGEVMKDEVKQFPDMTLTMTDGENDPSKFVANIDSAVARKVDLLIVAAGDGTVPARAVEKAVAAGIPVVAMQKAIATDAVTTTIIGDDVELGRQQAQGLVDALKARKIGKAEGELVIVNGPPAASLTVQQNKGFRAVIAENPGIKIVCDQNGQFAPDPAVKVLENCMQANPGANSVWFLGASIGPAMNNAIKRMGRADSVVMVGGSGSIETLKLMAAGGDKGPLQYDETLPDCVLPAIVAAHRILTGKDVPARILLKSRGLTSSTAQAVIDANPETSYLTWPTKLPVDWQ